MHQLLYLYILTWHVLNVKVQPWRCTYLALVSGIFPLKYPSVPFLCNLKQISVYFIHFMVDHFQCKPYFPKNDPGVFVSKLQYYIQTKVEHNIQIFTWAVRVFRLPFRFLWPWFHIETLKSFDLHYNSNYWFLYEMQHWAKNWLSSPLGM